MTYTKIGTMKTNWEDQIGGYLSEAGEELLIELIGKRLPDDVTWCDNDELLAPVDFAGELDVDEIVYDAIKEFLRVANVVWADPIEITIPEGYTVEESAGGEKNAV